MKSVELSNPRWWLGMKPRTLKTGRPNLTIAVVIPAYNEKACIADTIISIKNQTIKVDDIIVVDDCSSDETARIARKHGVSVICTPKNQGTKAMAQNYILKYLEHDLVATIDADTILKPDAIEKTLPYFNDEKTFAVCGFVIPQKIETIWERGRFIEYVFGIMIMKAAQNNFGLIMVASGCFSVFRYSLLKKFGYFNERTMAEDMDLTWVASFNGYKIYCDQDAICYPLDPATLSVYYKQLRRWYSGFLQNINVHKIDLIKHWNYGLLFMYYLLEAMLYPVIAALLFIWLFGMWKVMAAIFAIHALIVAIPTLYKGWRLKLFWKAFFSFPAYYLTRPVNVFAIYVSVINEWILKKRLDTWDKGH